MSIVRSYEEQVRQADLLDLSAGDVDTSRIIRAALDQIGALSRPGTVSADLLSTTAADLRIIEVKGRGSAGPIQLPWRELDTLTAADEHGWLYVVWNTTQPRPYRLWLVQDPQKLGWAKVRAASRGPDQPRGVRHEVSFQVGSAEVEASGFEVDLTAMSGLPVKPGGFVRTSSP